MRRARRGLSLLYVTGAVTVMAAFVGIALERSLDHYHTAAEAERRLELRAAAEGAAQAIAAARSLDLAPTQVGRVRVSAEPLSADAARVLAELRLPGSDVTHAATFTVRFRQEAASWTAGPALAE